MMYKFLLESSAPVRLCAPDKSRIADPTRQELLGDSGKWHGSAVATERLIIQTDTQANLRVGTWAEFQHSSVPSWAHDIIS
jgi:hypothetical protein